MDDDTSFRVQDDCEEPSLPSQPPRAQPFTGDTDNNDDNDDDVCMKCFTGGVSTGYPRPPHQDYVDRTDLRAGKGDTKGDSRGHVINTGALYRQPLLNGQGQGDKVGLVITDNIQNLLHVFIPGPGCGAKK